MTTASEGYVQITVNSLNYTSGGEQAGDKGKFQTLRQYACGGVLKTVSQIG